MSPVIITQGNRMMEFVKVIKAKMSQYSTTNSGDFEKVGQKNLQFKESMFLSFLLTQSAENFSMIDRETEPKFIMLS